MPSKISHRYVFANILSKDLPETLENYFLVSQVGYIEAQNTLYLRLKATVDNNPSLGYDSEEFAWAFIQIFEQIAINRTVEKTAQEWMECVDKVIPHEGGCIRDALDPSVSTLYVDTEACNVWERAFDLTAEGLIVTALGDSCDCL